MLKTSSCSGSCEQGMLMVMVVRDLSLTTFSKLHKVNSLQNNRGWCNDTINGLYPCEIP